MSTGTSDGFRYDLFISYSTEPDAALARDVERMLESFHHLKTPKELTLRELEVCRDGSDFSTRRLRADGEPEQEAVSGLIERYLRQSRQLLVICSRQARDSDWVNLEVLWFLRNRGADSILLAVSECADPGAALQDVFSPAILESGLNAKPWYDFRAFRGRASKPWRKVKPFEDEKVRLAADLNGMSAGEVQPVWFREQARSRRRRIFAATTAVVLILAAGTAALFQQAVAHNQQGLKLIAAAYELLYRDPSAALLKAYRASELVPGAASTEAIRAAYKVAMLHHHNRRETAQMTGSGPSYLAGRWKQGEVFSTTSPDGRHRLVVTERGENGPSPPGEVYLVNNESLRTTRLASCSRGELRVEDVRFDASSSRIFVSRYFEVSVYDLGGRCQKSIPMSCCTKSPVHLVAGMLAQRYALIAETKGGLWLVDVEQRETRPLVLQREFHGDAAVSVALSPDRQQAAVVFESGRVAIASLADGGKASLREVARNGALSAAFDPSEASRLLTAGSDGVLHRFDIGAAELKELDPFRIADTPIDSISFSDEGKEWLVVGENRSMYVVDHATGRVLSTIRETDGIDWAAARAVAGEPELAVPHRRSPTTSLPLTAEALSRGRTMDAADRRWVVAETQGDFMKAHATYAIDAASDMAIEVARQDVQSVERHGDLLWLKAPSASGTFAGPVVRIDADGINYYPGKDIEVVSVAARDGKLHLATARGLYTVLPTGSDMQRISKATLNIRGLYPIGGQLWVATQQGGYLIDKQRLYRVTEPFAQIREVKEVNGKIWMLTGAAGGLARRHGPAYLVDGYLSRPLPDPKTAVSDVVSVSGRTWLAGSPGLFVLDADRAVAVGRIAEAVTGIQEAGEGIRVKTRTDSWPETSAGPEYDVDTGSMTVRRR